MPSDITGVIAIGTYFAEQLCRARVLTNDETAMVARLTAKVPSSRPLRRWTAAQDEQLRDLLGSGHTAAEIGARIGRSTNAIHTRIKRLKGKGI